MTVSIVSTLRCLSLQYWRNTWHAATFLQLTPGSIASRRRRVVDICDCSVLSRSVGATPQITKRLCYLCLDWSRSIFSDRLPLALKDNQEPIHPFPAAFASVQSDARGVVARAVPDIAAYLWIHATQPSTTENGHQRLRVRRQGI